MAVTIPSVVAVLQPAINGAGMVGVSSAQISLAVATGFVSYVTGPLTLVTIDVGTAGVGAGTGFGLVLPPGAIAGPLAGFMAGAGILGPFSGPLALAIAAGLSQSLLAANLVTAHPSVGQGSGVATPLPNPGASVGLFQAGFSAAGLNGIMSRPLAAAVAAGLDAALPSAKGVLVIVGPPSTSPSSGVGTGKIL